MSLANETTAHKQTWRIPQSHGHGLGIALVVAASRAEVAAPAVVDVSKERDALTSYRSLARLFAVPNARHFLWRALEVFLSSTSVALNVGTYRLPYVSDIRSACK